MTEKEYYDFLKQKIVIANGDGIEIDDSQLSPGNLPHQNDTIRWAANLGRALIASSFGLGKTRIQCELARIVQQKTGKPFLVVCPLGVKHQFIQEDGPKLGINWKYVRTDLEAQEAGTPYLITNYERVRDGSLHADLLDIGGVSLDEGSVLRSLGSKTSQEFKRIFKNIPFRFVATATPSPNDYKELIYFAEFLGIMDHGQALTRFFKRDVNHAGHLILMPSQEKDFWMWVASWALFLYAPSDLGYSDEGYDLPPLNIEWHRIKVDQTRAFTQIDNRGQRRLLLDAAGGVKEATAEKRATVNDRVEAMAEIIRSMNGDSVTKENQLVVWVNMNDEQKVTERKLASMGYSISSIFGSLTPEKVEDRLYAWKRRETDILLGKPVMLGSGLNLQQAHNVIFVGVGYKFQEFIQAVHRVYRFMQQHPVTIHIIYAESEDNVVNILKKKWDQHNKLVRGMRDIIRKYGLSHEAMKKDLSRTIGVNRMETKQRLFTAIHNDCVLEIKKLADNSIDEIVTSIPFGNHYEYTVSMEDFGHNQTDSVFWQQMDFLIPDLLRVLKPGRVAAIHVKDRILYGHQTPTGFMEVAPFSDECVMAFRKHGFLYEGRRTIVTDVVRENASTYRLGYSEMCKDSTKMGCGLPEYLLLFRKPPTSSIDQRADEPVTKDKADYGLSRWQPDASSFWRSDGNTPLTPGELYNYEQHVARLAEKENAGNLPTSFFWLPADSKHPWVWDDVVFMQTLNTQQFRRGEENHICPLPFDIVERAIRLYSNEGDTVLDPFAGLFTVPVIAMKLRRKSIGIELSQRYYEAGLKYCQDMEREMMAPTLFDYLKVVGVKETA